MAINYKEMVNNGIDNKVFVEKCIEGLMREGISASDIEKSKKFISPHYELLNKLRSNYLNKELDYIGEFGSVGQDAFEQLVADQYYVKAHPIKELYPDIDEDQEYFKERDRLKEEIEFLKESDTTNLEKEKNRIINAITKLEINNPILDNIKEYLKEYDELVSKIGTFPEPLVVQELMSRHSLSIKDAQKNEKLYSHYLELEKQLTDTIVQIDNMKKDRSNNKRVFELEGRIKEIENYLISKNAKLINWFLRTYFRDALFEMEDAYQVCLIALWNAVKDYDYKKASFSTYAVLLMKHEIDLNIESLTGYNRYEFNNIKALKTIMNEYYQLTGKEATIDELMDYGILGMSKSIAKRTIEKQGFIISDVVERVRYEDETDYEKELKKEFDSKGFIDDDSNHDVVFIDPEEDYTNEFEGADNLDTTDLEGQVNYLLLREDIDKVLDTLTPEEKMVLQLRFGLTGHKPMSLEDVGKVFGVSRERIRQREAKALRKLRQPGRSNYLKPYLEGDNISGKRL